MKKLIAWILLIFLTSATFATMIKPIACSEFVSFPIIKKQIKTINPSFQGDSNCQIVATKSIFPRKKNNSIQFEQGVGVFIYENNQLKFICVPGWNCKAW